MKEMLPVKVHSSEIRVSSMTVEINVPVSGSTPFLGEKVIRPARFKIDPETWECEGEMDGAVMTPTDLWDKLKNKAVKFAKESLAAQV